MRREDLEKQQAALFRQRARLTMPVDPKNGCMVGPEGCHYDTPQDLMYFDVLKLCGCGCPEEVHALLLDSANAFAGEWDARGGIGAIEQIVRERPAAVAQFIAHFLDQRGITEHGGSVYGSWLTPLGEQFVEVGPMTGDDDDQ